MPSKTTPQHCPYCDLDHHRKDNPGEHVIPEWISREFPDATWLVTNRLTGYVRKSEKYINLTTPIPCADCDSGWMSGLENLTKPVLTPLLHGNCTTLTWRDQITLVTWMFKTATTFDLHAAKRAPHQNYFEPNELRHLKETCGFSPTYSIYIGRYNGDAEFRLQETHSDVTLRRNDITVGKPKWRYALTLVIKHLVLQIFCAKLHVLPLQFNVNPFIGFSYQVGIEPNDLTWPPPQPFTDSQIEEFVHRWAANPPLA